MATPFKLKSGNASAFKNLGSSPAKQMPENWNKGVTPGYNTTKAAKTENFRKAADKIKTVRSTQVDPSGKVKVKTSKLPPLSTAKKELAKKISTKNIKVDIPTGKKELAKSAKGLQSKMPKGWDVAKKASSRYVNPNIAKQLTKKATSRTLGKLATGVVRKGAGRLLGGPAGLVTGLAYGAYKSGQKHSGGKAVKGQKSFMTEAKKKQVSIMKEGKKKKSILSKNK